MRNINIEIGEYYHAFNRGNSGQLIFLDDNDRARFLFLILYLQSPEPVNHISGYAEYFVKRGRFNVSGKITSKQATDKLVDLIGFVLMPSYFHLILKEKVESGISRYMHRVQVSYTKYFNTKYRKAGHLLQGTYLLQYIEKDADLEHLSAYIHKRPKELQEWRNRMHLYPWSSYQDYLSVDRFTPLLSKELIPTHFKTPAEYKKFVDSSKPVEIENYLGKIQRTN